MAKSKKQKRNIKVENGKTTMTFSFDTMKHKMDPQELENHLHLKRTGHADHGNKKKYNRKEKHKTKY